jgi:hypothetical protein
MDTVYSITEQLGISTYSPVCRRTMNDANNFKMRGTGLKHTQSELDCVLTRELLKQQLAH